MKRFYKSVAVAPSGDAFAVALDGRPIRTPKGAPLALPTRALAEAISAEWAGQGEEIDQRAMPLTGLANTAIDHVAADRDAVIRQIESFARHDLVCYRAEDPPALVAREAHAWDGPLAWARAEHGLDLATTGGLGSVDQPSVTFAAMTRVLARYDAFVLTGLTVAAGIAKSVVLALSLADGRLDAAQVHAAAHVDEAFQAEKWGFDAEAEARLKTLLAELETAARFMRLAAA